MLTHFESLDSIDARNRLPQCFQVARKHQPEHIQPRRLGKKVFVQVRRPLGNSKHFNVGVPAVQTQFFEIFSDRRKHIRTVLMELVDGEDQVAPFISQSAKSFESELVAGLEYPEQTEARARRRPGRFRQGVNFPVSHKCPIGSRYDQKQTSVAPEHPC